MIQSRCPMSALKPLAYSREFDVHLCLSFTTSKAGSSMELRLPHSSWDRAHQRCIRLAFSQFRLGPSRNSPCGRQSEDLPEAWSGTMGAVRPTAERGEPTRLPAVAVRRKERHALLNRTALAQVGPCLPRQPGSLVGYRIVLIPTHSW